VLGAVIVAVDGRAVADTEQFVRALQDFDIGQRVNLDIRRGDLVRTVEVTIMDIS
jgi:S1-C subfamily serine protease